MAKAPLSLLLLWPARPTRLSDREDKLEQQAQHIGEEGERLFRDLSDQLGSTSTHSAPQLEVGELDRKLPPPAPGWALSATGFQGERPL